MKLEKTLKNLRITKDSFFNCKKDDFISFDLYKHNTSVYYENDYRTFILNINKNLKLIHSSTNKCGYYHTIKPDEHGFYNCVLYYKISSDGSYYLKLLK
jgi:hypothetical protein